MSSKNICVFASSCDYLEQIYYDEAAKLGELMAKSGMNIAYGGSSLGLMWACAKEVKANGGKLIGVMPKKLHDLGVNTDICDEYYITECMRSRKAKMDEFSDGLISLAGGFGTLEELSEMIVQKQLGYNNKPIVILNTNGFYDKLIEFFEVIITENFARESVREIYYVASTPEEAVEYIKNYNYASKPVTKDEIYGRDKRC